MVNLSDILMFFTGARKIPGTGLENYPSIKFSNEEMLPRASTCECSITFSRSASSLSEIRFKEMMNECILGSYGYGQV
jgi:hypothetical protein